MPLFNLLGQLFGQKPQEAKPKGDRYFEVKIGKTVPREVEEKRAAEKRREKKDGRVRVRA